MQLGEQRSYVTEKKHETLYSCDVCFLWALRKLNSEVRCGHSTRLVLTAQEYIYLTRNPQIQNLMRFHLLNTVTINFNPFYDSDLQPVISTPPGVLEELGVPVKLAMQIKMCLKLNI
jgi:hypothetical protein